MVIARVAGPIAEDHLQAEVLYKDRPRVVAGTASPWSRRRRVGLADLMNEPWVLPPLDSDAGMRAIDAFRVAKVDLPRATVFSLNAVARIALVAKGRFLTIAAEVALRFASSGMTIKALPIDLPAMQGAVGIVTLRNRTLSPAAQLFIDCAREIANPVTRGRSVLALSR